MAKTRGNWSLIGFLLFVGLLIAGLWHTLFPDQISDKRVALNAGFTVTPVQGQGHHYSVHYESSGTMDLGAQKAPSKSQEVRLTLDGELKEIVLGPNSALELRFEKVKIDGFSSFGTDFQALTRQLELPFFLKLSATGKPEGAVYDEKCGEMVRGILKGLIGLLQFQVPATNPVKVPYQIEEGDAVGSYLAKYELKSKPESNPLVFVKTKLHYLEQKNPDSATQFFADTEFKVLGSRVEFKIKQEPFLLLSLSAADEVDTFFMARKMGHSESRLKLNWLRSDAIEPVVLTRLQETFSAAIQERRLKLVTAPTAADVQRDVLMATLGPFTRDTLPRLLKSVHRFDKEIATEEPGGMTVEWQQAMLKLNALLILHTELTREVVAELARMDFRTRAAEVIIAALMNAPTHEANDETSALLSQKFDEPLVAIRLLPVIQGNPFPSDQVQTAVEKVAREHPRADIKTMAVLSLGAIAQHYRDGEPDKAVGIVDGFQKKLQATQDQTETIHLLAAIGNGALDDTAERIKPYLTDARPNVRAEAVSSLRMVRGAGAATTLRQRLLEDSEVSVRSSAAIALGKRSDSQSKEGVAVLTEAIHKESSAEVLSNVLSSLASIAGKQPELTRSIRDAFEWCSGNVKSNELRGFCANQISGLKR
jgi:hypothetical protein